MARVTNAVTNTVQVTATAPVLLLAENTDRMGALINNTSGTILYVLLGAGIVSSALYTVKLTTASPTDYYELPPFFTGPVTCIRNSGTTPQPVIVTEFIS